MALGGGAWKQLSYEGGAFMYGISILIRDPRESPHPFHHVQHRSQPSATQKRALIRTQPCWDPDLGLSDPTTVRNKYPCFMSHPVCDILS